MATIYQKYLKLNIDSACLGLEQGESKSDYFCTPKGAKVIGWAGTDGIHYCFVRGFGEMVFAVSPMNTPGNYVHPLARDFKDFLRLLLACGDAAVLEQASYWEREQFDTFLQDNPPSAEQQAVLDTIGEKLSLSPMEQPFAYIKELQAEFDYSRLKFPEEYAEWVPAARKIPKWKVYFDGNFWGHQGRERAGKEISLLKQFDWNGQVCWIPAIYSCSKGLVLDICLQVPAESVRSFMDKWNPSLESEATGFSDEQRMRIEAENPLAVNLNLEIGLNGKVLPGSHGCALTWNPCCPAEDNGLEARSAVLHYGLDPAYGWVIRRAAFPWRTKRKPKIKSLSVTLSQMPVPVPGPHFYGSAPGESFTFTHPATGVQHTLTVQEYERQEVPPEHFTFPNQEFPRHYTMMSYTLAPDLPNHEFAVTDSVRSDQPRQKSVYPYEPQASSSVAIGIIGGADGPTAVFLGGKGQGKLHVACSALHFEPADQVEWRLVFYEKRRQDVTVELVESFPPPASA